MIAGNYDENDPKFDDLTFLTENLKTDMRVWGFQICLDNSQDILAGFRLQLAKDYGINDNFIDLASSGPESTPL